MARSPPVPLSFPRFFSLPLPPSGISPGQRVLVRACTRRRPSPPPHHHRETTAPMSDRQRWSPRSLSCRGCCCYRRRECWASSRLVLRGGDNSVGCTTLSRYAISRSRARAFATHHPHKRLFRSPSLPPPFPPFVALLFRNRYARTPAHPLNGHLKGVLKELHFMV